MAGRVPHERYLRDLRLSPFGSAHASLTSRISAGKTSCIITTTPHFSVSAPLYNICSPYTHLVFPLTMLLVNGAAYWVAYFLYEQCIPGYYGLMSEYDGWISPTLVLKKYDMRFLGRPRLLDHLGLYFFWGGVVCDTLSAFTFHYYLPSFVIFLRRLWGTFPYSMPDLGRSYIPTTSFLHVSVGVSIPYHITTGILCTVYCKQRST